MAVGVEVQIENDKVYLSKSITEFTSDFTIGFNPFCMAGGYKKYYSDKQKESITAFYSELWYPKPLTIVDKKKYDPTKAGISKEAMDANKKALVRLVNFEGANEEYCAKPVL